MRVRRVLERVLGGKVLAFLLHMRPRSFPIVIAHMTVGFLLAVGLCWTGEQMLRWALAALAWGVLGNGGTLALNSAFDRDEGDIGYLEAPPPVPRGLGGFAAALLVGGVPIAGLVGARFAAVYVVCAVLSVLYSVPPFRFKARAGLDVLTNASGYGALTAYAGWAAADRALSPPIVNVVLAFFCFFVGFYPLTQIYQFVEDAQRGDRTLALSLGKTNALRVAVSGVVAGFSFLAVEVLQRYRGMRAVGLLLGVVAWMAVLVPWYAHRGEVDVQYEKRRFYLALYAWALTDVVVVMAMMPVV
jgi:4-hydroxybenzoate polyprenyltransferase